MDHPLTVASIEATVPLTADPLAEATRFTPEGPRTRGEVQKWLSRCAGPRMLALTEQAREWAMDCAWTDYDAEDMAGLDMATVWRGVGQHFDGGIPAFLAGAA